MIVNLWKPVGTALLLMTPLSTLSSWMRRTYRAARFLLNFYGSTIGTIIFLSTSCSIWPGGDIYPGSWLLVKCPHAQLVYMVRPHENLGAQNGHNSLYRKQSLCQDKWFVWIN